MERVRDKTMTRGILLFAFNTPNVNYVEMAVETTKRSNYFLNLPVTLITDNISAGSIKDYIFDNILFASAQTENNKNNMPWYNKGRYRAFELTPYDETIILDTDYLINSDRLLHIFDCYDDFCCHNSTSFLMQPNLGQEYLSNLSFQTLWATVIAFKKTRRTQHIFECLEMVQNNYEHYENIHKFIGGVFRNDFSLTLALRIANGHIDNKQDIIPWNLIHSGRNTTLYKNTDKTFNTEYTVMFDNWRNGKIRKEYTIIKDCDFHVMNKKNFVEIMK
jgi:hypothetical protein